MGRKYTYHKIFRPEKCSYCEKHFGREAGVNQHIAKAHKKETAKPEVENNE